MILEGTEDDDGLVVEVFCAGLKSGHGIDDGLDGGGCRWHTHSLQDLRESFSTEHLACGVDCVWNAVGEEDDEVAGTGGESELLVLDVGEETKREAFGLDCLNVDRCSGAGGGH